ncbi:hypothetical protein [Altererythrobacter litoralis]|uniref:Uncharacterized protein n=1 Tax=Altererythrobacter litoralis TaxID=3113904 RepID=A0ABU7GGQ0_9SPHN|nr:hypothetical protein [Erythrobacteraceae bacterium 1XM1-14]
MAFTPAPAAAQEDGTSLDVREFTCPLGGASFNQDVGYYAFPLLTMPDGSWLGDYETGVQIPVCPNNGLVLLPDLTPAEDEDADGNQPMRYLAYSAPELAALPALIADPEYHALKSDGGYAQAWWIADKLGHSPLSRFMLLQRSTWATRDPALRKKLVARFADHAPALVAQFPQEDMRKHYSQLLIVNALRELGRFDEALVYLDAIDFEAAAYEPIGSILLYGEKLRLAIAQRDDGRFAAETLPGRMVGEICGGGMAVVYGPTSPATKASCKIRRDREEQEERDRKAAYELRDDIPALTRKCADVPPPQRGGALILACDLLQDDLERIAANELTKDGRALAAKCDASDEESRDEAMRQACFNYASAIKRALGEQLPDDPEAFALFCGEEATGGGADEDFWLPSACVRAEISLEHRKVERLLADPATLAGLCAREEEVSKNDVRLDAILSRTCLSYELDQERAAIANLASDVAAFDCACGKFRKTNSAGNEVYGLSEAQTECRNAWRLRENDKARAAAEAKGLKCFNDASYSPDRPRCVSPEKYALEMAPAVDDGPDPFDLSYFNEGSSLMEVAHLRAAAIIAEAKRIGRRPDEL